jgi:NAD(P)-dependent dehydrogenase (short-subunit alcohol dehydrogenase family)
MPTKRAEVGAGVADVDLTGQTVLVTGSTAGIGRETALALGRLGARVFVHGRDRRSGEAVVSELGGLGVEARFFPADFADLDAVRRLADEVARSTDELDVLVNNAGGYFRKPRTTDIGVEYTMAVNHVAPYVLTNLLLPTIRAAPAGRVVTVSSEAHRNGRMDFEAIERVDRYSSWGAYARSKLANVLFSYELARRVDDVSSNCLHPGVIPGSGFMRDLPGPVRAFGSLVAAIPFAPVSSVVEGAETSVYLAASPDVADVTGAYFEDCRERRSAPDSYDESLQRRLWEYTADLVGVDETGGRRPETDANA